MRIHAIAAAALVALLAGCGGGMNENEEPQVPQAAPAEPEPGQLTDDDVARQQQAAQQTVDEYADTDPSALTDFKPTLDPYGSWVEDPTYGTVWVPSTQVVGSDFAPYVSNGHWAVDEYDRWVWVSDYDPTFGWVVFHYGRWVWIDNRGWAWIPGRRWAPAWVVWRVGDYDYDYLGWAPAPPYYYWGVGGVVWLTYYPPAPYVFCSTTYVFHEHVGAYIVDRGHIAAVAGRTHPYGTSGDPRHVLATPQAGPTPTSGHIAAAAWPSSHVAAAPSHASFARPSAMGRAPSVHAIGPHATTPSVGAWHPRTYAAGASGPAFAGAGSYRPSAPRSLGSTYVPSSPSHALAPSRGPSPIPSHSYSPSPFGGSRPYAPSAGSRSFGGGGYTPHYGGGGYAPHAPTYSPSHSVPHYSPAPSRPSGGGFRGGGGFHGGGGHHR